MRIRWLVPPLPFARPIICYQHLTRTTNGCDKERRGKQKCQPWLTDGGGYPGYKEPKSNCILAEILPTAKNGSSTTTCALLNPEIHSVVCLQELWRYQSDITPWVLATIMAKLFIRPSSTLLSDILDLRVLTLSFTAGLHCLLTTYSCLLFLPEVIGLIICETQSALKYRGFAAPQVLNLNNQ
ncbi:uncharacterized protein BO95DRAFT_479087 [Aspergillus brunneoviolaceus CBS 621.78]|uniref:Uncharacterized protein n=1 Tax=Aspergillus brunneoviolaceus CBS 621.78 TaxID=1450534 RepID=A0ACD1GKL1_9EURO|nr:hypothetical protein BO95DRAFT_479087 [Aspergillus brunneoviolaceus CBS 621.78]RAH49798.1 hypothetical protein BO95DRAFT_479087 [Aspergillus brunneoviolaceus CBS 621.78]